MASYALAWQNIAIPARALLWVKSMTEKQSSDLVGRYKVPVKCALEEALRVVGVEKLKQKQEEALFSFLAGNDTFVSLPTGYGKSIIYGILPVVFDLLLGK